MNTLSESQIAANRRSAINVVRTQLNLADKATSEWTYDERVNYDKTLAAYITAHAAAFGEQDLATAKDVSNSDYSALDNEEFSFKDFGSEVVTNVANAGAKVGDLGTGVLDSVSFVGKLLPYVVIAAGLGLAYVFFLKGKAKINAL